MECVGSVDALRTHTAMLQLRLADVRLPDEKTINQFLSWLLHTFFVLGSFCSDPECKRPEYHTHLISAADLERLEKEQTRLESQIDLPRAFILSPSNLASAEAELARVAARTLERQLVRLQETLPEARMQPVLPYVNRLSDYFFILARHLDQGRFKTVDYTTLNA